jgi:hypothetical protein
MGKAAFAPVSLYRLPITPLATDDLQVANFPLPGLSCPVSSSLGLVQANFAVTKGIFTLCAFRSVPECCGTASPRAPPRTALHVWTDLRRYALNFQQPSVGSRQESITVRLRSTTDAGLSPGKGLLNFFSPVQSPVLEASALFVWLTQVRLSRFWPQFAIRDRFHSYLVDAALSN